MFDLFFPMLLLLDFLCNHPFLRGEGLDGRNLALHDLVELAQELVPVRSVVGVAYFGRSLRLRDPSVEGRGEGLMLLR